MIEVQDVLALCKTKIKGKQEVIFLDIYEYVSGVNERVRAKEGVVVLIDDEMWECVEQCKEVN